MDSNDRKSLSEDNGKNSPEPRSVPNTFKEEANCTVECSNLLHILKLVVKSLLDTAVHQGRSIDEDHPLLVHLFTILENVLCHGLRSNTRKPSGFFGSVTGLGSGGPWAVLQLVPTVSPDAAEMTTTVRDLSDLRTGLGRTRAWLRLALMQKKLGEYMRTLVESRDKVRLSDHYYPAAFLMQEEATVMAGVLLGLNLIDCNVVMKDSTSALDVPHLGVIQYSTYMRKAYEDGLNDYEQDRGVNEEELDSLLDQKNYLEELCEHLRTNVSNLQRKLLDTERALEKCKTELTEEKHMSLAFREEVTMLRSDKQTLTDKFERYKQELATDMRTERDTYQTSRQGLDALNADLQKRLKEETQMRLDAERALENEVRHKVDGEMSQNQVETRLHEKHEVVVTLRNQLDSVKTINLELSGKLKESTESLHHKSMLVTRLEEKNAGMAEIMGQMQNRITALQSDKQAAEETARKIGQQLALMDSKCSEKETALRIQTERSNSLQQQLDQAKELMITLKETVEQMGEKEKECDRLTGQVSDLELALTEMALQVKHTKLAAEGLREEHAALQEAQWADDKEVMDCRQCNRPFNVSRRKHHCRHCGGIYCSECSNNKMPLASSSKPVRVCDTCHNLLLQRYTQRP